MPQEIGPGYLPSAQGGQVLRVLLAVNQGDAMTAAQADKGRQGDLGGVGFMCKHGFSEHRATQRHAVQAPDELPIDPGFHAVGMACQMQFGVGVDHLRNDPGASLAFAFLGGAGGDDVPERAVDADFAVRLSAKCLQLFAQRAAQPELSHRQHHARIRCPPQDGLPGAVPGKGALCICSAQAGHIQRAACCQQPRRGIAFSPRKGRCGKGGVGFEPGQLWRHAGGERKSTIVWHAAFSTLRRGWRKKSPALRKCRAF